MRKSRNVALAGVFSALAVALMWIGAISGFGTYASPMLAGIALIPVGLALGKRYHLLSFVTVLLLSVLLSADWEMNLLFIGLFGWYPVLAPLLERLKKPLKYTVKLLIFNAVIIGIEALVMLVIAPTGEAPWMLITLLALGNITFLFYDFILPRVTIALMLRLKLNR